MNLPPEPMMPILVGAKEQPVPTPQQMMMMRQLLETMAQDHQRNAAGVCLPGCRACQAQELLRMWQREEG